MPFYHKIHCNYTGAKGFVTAYEDGLRWRMLTKKAKKKFEILVFWKNHGLQATMDTFHKKRRTLFDWKRKYIKGGGKPEALNEKKTTPKTKRKRLWPFEMRQEIKRLRTQYPNLGSEKVYPLLLEFCEKEKLKCPKPKTISRIIADDSEKMRIFPQKVSHFGRIYKANRQKVLRKPKDLKTEHPGHLVALDTIEKFIDGTRRYVITFEDIHSRFAFAWATKSHASKAAEEFFAMCIDERPCRTIQSHHPGRIH